MSDWELHGHTQAETCETCGEIRAGFEVCEIGHMRVIEGKTYCSTKCTPEATAANVDTASIEELEAADAILRRVEA